MNKFADHHLLIFDGCLKIALTQQEEGAHVLDLCTEFVQPELEASCRRLVTPFYHLDGPGQLVHLDHLLGMPNLKGIQWVPGAGQPGPEGWPEIYRRIREAGRLAQVVPEGEPMTPFDKVAKQVGSAKGLYYLRDIAPEHSQTALKWLSNHT